MQDRRTTGVRTKGRAERVVTSILKATGEELDQVGFAALRVEDVAERAGVNKTTIYRRWPTKNELVMDALRSSYEEQVVIPETGNLREDMLQYIKHLMGNVKNPISRGAMVTLHNCTDPAIKPIADELLSKAREARVQIVRRGIERGELPKSADPEVISDLFSAPILRRLLTFNEKVKPSYIQAVIDTVIAGANAVSAKRSPRRV
jgi:AcrR family transcriptional regulator